MVIGIGKISNLLFNVEKPEVSGYKVEVSEEVSKKSVAQKEEKVEVDISALMAQADLAHGEKIFKKCSACHSIQAGGGNKIGPALYNVVGRKVAVVEDYKYSKALVAYKQQVLLNICNLRLLQLFFPQHCIKLVQFCFPHLLVSSDMLNIF